MAWIFQQPIRCFYFMVFEANTRRKKEDTTGKAMKSWVRECYIFLCTINFEVTWPFWKMWNVKRLFKKSCSGETKLSGSNMRVQWFGLQANMNFHEEKSNLANWESDQTWKQAWDGRGLPCGDWNVVRLSVGLQRGGFRCYGICPGTLMPQVNLGCQIGILSEAAREKIKWEL